MLQLPLSCNTSHVSSRGAVGCSSPTPEFTNARPRFGGGVCRDDFTAERRHTVRGNALHLHKRGVPHEIFGAHVIHPLCDHLERHGERFAGLEGKGGGGEDRRGTERSCRPGVHVRLGEEKQNCEKTAHLWSRAWCQRHPAHFFSALHPFSRPLQFFTRPPLPHDATNSEVYKRF